MDVRCDAVVNTYVGIYVYEYVDVDVCVCMVVCVNEDI